MSQKKTKTKLQRESSENILTFLRHLLPILFIGLLVTGMLYLTTDCTLFVNYEIDGCYINTTGSTYAKIKSESQDQFGQTYLYDTESVTKSVALNVGPLSRSKSFDPTFESFRYAYRTRVDCQLFELAAIRNELARTRQVQDDFNQLFKSELEDLNRESRK